MSPSRLFKLLQRSQRSVHGGRWLTLALGSVLATGAGAAPLPAGVDRYVLVAAPATECSATDSAAPVICAASTEALMAYATTGKWGETITASAAFGVDNFQVHLKGKRQLQPGAMVVRRAGRLPTHHVSRVGRGDGARTRRRDDAGSGAGWPGLDDQASGAQALEPEG